MPLYAVAKFEEFGPHVLVSDIGMPHEDGFSLIKTIRQRQPDFDVVAIALTGFSGDRERERALESGFHEFIVKPVVPESLVESMLRLLAARQEAR